MWTLSSKKSLKTRITLAMLFIFFVGLWSLSFISSQQLRKDVEHLLGNQQLSTVSMLASKVDSELSNRMGVLNSVAKGIEPSMLEKPAAVQAFLENRMGLQTLFSGGIVVLRPDGTIIADIPIETGRIGVNLMERDSIAAALNEGKSMVGKPVVGKKLASPIFHMTVPIRDAQGKVIGALSGVVDLGVPNFLDQITANRYGNTGGYLLVAPKHRLVVTSTDKTRVMEASPPIGTIPAIDRFHEGYEGTAAYVNSFGVEMLSSAKGIPTAAWYVVANLPAEEAFAPIHDMQRRMWITTLLLTVLAGGLTWWVLRVQLSPVVDTIKSLAPMADGSQPLRTLFVARQDELGQLIGSFNRLLENLTNREEALRESDTLQKTMLSNMLAGVIIVDASTRQIERVNPAAAAMFGATPEEIIGNRCHAFLCPAAEGACPILDMNKTVDNAERVILCANGSQRPVIKSVTRIQILGKEKLLECFVDITERKEADKALEQSVSLLRATLDSTADGILTVDNEGRIVQHNQRFLDLWKIPKSLVEENRDEQLLAHVAEQLVDPEAFVAKVKELYSHPELESVDVIEFKDGRIYERYSTPQRVRSSTVGRVWSFRNITEHKHDEEKIKALAFFDQLTNLPNRTLMLDRIKQYMTSSLRTGRYGALLLIDLDNFKALNDTLGHDMGDLLLKHVSQRLVACVRAEDTVARLGGDEFVVVLPALSVNKSDAAANAEMIGKKIVGSLNRTYQLGNVTHHITPSIGANMFVGAQAEVDTLLKQADIAMYRAKKDGGNALRFFDPDMEAIVMKRAGLESDLREAIDKEEFILHYQAQVSEGRLTGAEALIRWQHPQRGLVSPGDFIAVTEDTGLILPLGHWVLEAACTQLAAWAERPEMEHLTISVNVSARQFRQENFVDQVLAVLTLTRANPRRLKLELTESLLLSNVDDVIEKMFALKTKGVGFSLDDFGTGYSSLSYLKRLPLDQLKIDQSFVRDVLVDPNDASIARTVIALAQSLGLGVIAEGVETSAQRDYLSSAGCNAFQGYFFGRPVPKEEFESAVSSAHDATAAVRAATCDATAF